MFRVINGSVGGPVIANDYPELEAKARGQWRCNVPNAGDACRGHRAGETRARLRAKTASTRAQARQRRMSFRDVQLLVGSAEPIMKVCC